MHRVFDVTCSQVMDGQAGVMDDVSDELGRQLQKWGTQNHQPIYWLGILGEEYGEAAKWIIEWGVCRPGTETVPMLYLELVQIAAVAIAAAECLNRTLIDDVDFTGPSPDDGTPLPAAV
jgi:hypothetical protein